MSIFIVLRPMVLGSVALTLSASAMASGDLVKFPDDYAKGVHYATVPRGNIRQELFTSRETIQAVKSGKPIPSGTVITLVDYRDGKVFRYVVMEKRSGWGNEYSTSLRNGEWEYQAFNADKLVNRAETLGRCFTCHKQQESEDYVYTLQHMKSMQQ